MLGLLIPSAALAVAGVALFRRRRRPDATAPPATAPGVRTDLRAWRNAASESDSLRIAVDQMRDHCDLAQQIADSWLVAANLHARDPRTFQTNVREAEAMMIALECECAAVVEELRALEHKHDQADAFDARRTQALAFTHWATQQEGLLRARLNEAARTAALNADDLRQAAAKGKATPAVDAFDTLLPRFASPEHIPLRSIVA